MPSPTPKSRPQSSKTSRQPRQPHPAAPEAVSPIWLAKAFGVVLLAALVCGYLSVCLLFYQGQWQLVLHPSRSTSAPATIAGAQFETIRFGVDESAAPQLTGWLIPAEPASHYSAYTILYLPSGDGSLANATSTLAAIHSIGINIFALDYRGYGQSAPARPTQKRMTEDAASAWQYLTVSRAIPPSRLIPFGDGVGAALATQLAAAHSEIPALILESPRPDLLQIALDDPRTKSLPVHALFHERFEISAPLATFNTPKLFLLSSSPPAPGASASAIQSLTTNAASPKLVSTLSPTNFNGPLYRDQLTRFLDQYLH